MKHIEKPTIGGKCLSCRFCLWYDYMQHYACSIRGCYEYSKYIEFQCIYDKNKKEWR